MSKKTMLQMEFVLKDRLLKAEEKLYKLQQKHKLAIGELAYKHALHFLDLEQLDLLFAKLAQKDFDHA